MNIKYLYMNTTNGYQKSNYKLILTIFVLVLATTIQGFAQGYDWDAIISITNVDYDIYRGGEDGILIHAYATTEGHNNVKWLCTAYLMDNQNNTLTNRYNGSTTFGASYFTPQYSTSTFSDLQIFIPYSSIKESISYGTSYLQCFLSISPTDDEPFESPVSNVHSFVFNNPKPATPTSPSYNNLPKNNTPTINEGQRLPMISATFYVYNSNVWKYQFDVYGGVTSHTYNSRDREGKSIIPGTEGKEYGTYYVEAGYSSKIAYLHIRWADGKKVKFTIHYEGSVTRITDNYNRNYYKK